jgi:hypothetical protein
MLEVGGTVARDRERQKANAFTAEAQSTERTAEGTHHRDTEDTENFARADVSGFFANAINSARDANRDYWTATGWQDDSF